MKLSEQVISLEQAKRLKELGIEQKSICYHHFQKDYGFAGVQENKENHTVSFGKPPMITDMAYSAFTVAELGVMLPPFTYSWMGRANTYGCVSSNQEPNDDYINYSVENGQISNGANEAECRAAQLIYLLENNLVTPAEINQRLTN